MYHARVEPAVFDPEDLHGLRARINAETGGAYAAFRNALVPDYGKVKRAMASAYLALAAIVVGAGILGPLAIPVSAIAIGFTIAYLQLFLHEAAHFGLAADRDHNDRTANRLICWQVGTDIASYRAAHWEHHRSLGGPKDTEISYRNAPSPRFLLQMLTGVHAVRVFAKRNHAPVRSPSKNLWPLVRGASVHLILLTSLMIVGWWAAVVAWIAGVSIFFPFFATLRQILEHRPGRTGGAGRAVTRLFGDDLLSRLLGGAGFNRHMLHHLEPQVSCTRLAELEAYLNRTSAKAELDARRSTYLSAFLTLVRSN